MGPGLNERVGWHDEDKDLQDSYQHPAPPDHGCGTFNVERASIRPQQKVRIQFATR
jgi:hypothetical protein